MVDKKKVIGSILKTAKEVNVLLAKDKKLSVSNRMDIFGGKSLLDSFGLVTFLVDLEQRLLQENGLSVSMMDPKAFSQKKSPFRNVDSLADFICNNAKEA